MEFFVLFINNKLMNVATCWPLSCYLPYLYILHCDLQKSPQSHIFTPRLLFLCSHLTDESYLQFCTLVHCSYNGVFREALLLFNKPPKIKGSQCDGWALASSRLRLRQLLCFQTLFVSIPCKFITIKFL